MQNGSPLVTDPGAFSIHPARPGSAYKMLPPLLVSSHFASFLLISNPQTPNQLCEPCCLCFQIPPLVIHPGFSKWHLHLFCPLGVMSTNTGLISFLSRKLEPGDVTPKLVRVTCAA